MSAALVTPRLTVREFLMRPERTDGCTEELILGEIVVSPNAKPVHNYVTSRLMYALHPLEASGTYLVLGEVACRLSDESLPNADACVFLRSVYAESMASDNYPNVAPMLAIEVASPGNRRMHTKADLFLQHGAAQVWLVYPRSRTVTVLLADGDQYSIHEDETLEFAGVSVPVRSLFQINRAGCHEYRTGAIHA